MTNKKLINQDASPEFERVGVFQAKLRLQVVEELNRRNIAYCLEEVDAHATELHVLRGCSTEAVCVLNEIKNRNKRIRF